MSNDLTSCFVRGLAGMVSRLVSRTISALVIAINAVAVVEAWRYHLVHMELRTYKTVRPHEECLRCGSGSSHTIRPDFDIYLLCPLKGL